MQRGVAARTEWDSRVAESGSAQRDEWERSWTPDPVILEAPAYDAGASVASRKISEAVIQSAAVRTRPIFLTAGTTLLGNWVITLDPIFSGLAWAIIFGVFTSTVFTLLVVPVVYWLLYGGNQAAGPQPPKTGGGG